MGSETEDGTIEESPAHFLTLYSFTLSYSHITITGHWSVLRCAASTHQSFSNGRMACHLYYYSCVFRSQIYAFACFPSLHFVYIHSCFIVHTVCRLVVLLYTTFSQSIIFSIDDSENAQQKQQINKKTNEQRRQKSSLKQITD